jgi:hypothetical protein
MAPSLYVPIAAMDRHLASTSREPPPLFVIARHFEKLERSIVGRVRALKGRMSDVERWLVEKENKRGGDGGTVNEMRVELMGVQPSPIHPSRIRSTRGRAPQ